MLECRNSNTSVSARHQRELASRNEPMNEPSERSAEEIKGELKARIIARNRLGGLTRVSRRPFSRGRPRRQKTKAGSAIEKIARQPDHRLRRLKMRNVAGVLHLPFL